jgi:hypothetical protein
MLLEYISIIGVPNSMFCGLADETSILAELKEFDKTFETDPATQI